MVYLSYSRNTPQQIGNLYEETPLSGTGLQLRPVDTALVQQAGRAVKDSEIQARQMSLCSWQPEIICISLAKKKIAIGPEVTFPSDSRSAPLLEAHNRKLQSYTPLLAALQEYVDSGWTVSILPWVVGGSERAG